jgi:putative hydrolase of the HAD superfamily
MQGALLLDADGVVLRNKGYFSEHFAKEQQISIERINPFFKKEFSTCQAGKADLKEELAKYLPQWEWRKTTNEFIQSWFSYDVELDPAVFAEVSRLRTSGIACYLASDQEKYRASYLRNEKGLKNSLDGCFFSCELGVMKNDPSYFNAVLNELGIPAEQVTYFDDDQKNVDSARSVGISAHFYSGIDMLRAFG